MKKLKHPNISLHKESSFFYFCEENKKMNMINCLTYQGWCNVDCAGVNQK